MAYLFTWSDNGIEAETVAQWPGWRVAPLPAEMLAALRATAPHSTTTTRRQNEQVN